MTGFLRDGLEGRSLKATLWVYLLGLILLAPIGIFVALFYDTRTSFQATPVLVLALALFEYAVAYRALGFSSLLQNRDRKVADKSFVSKLWEEFSPILRHGCITGLSLLMIASLKWLVDQTTQIQTRETLYVLDRLLYIGLFAYFGIAVIVELLLSFVRDILHKVERRESDKEGEMITGENASPTVRRRLTSLLE